MKWKTFLQVLALVLIAGAVAFVVYPKYSLQILTDRSTDKEIVVPIKINRITGEVYILAGNQWNKVR